MEWIRAKAHEATESSFNAAIVWKCIHDLKAVDQGLRPVQTSAIVDANGNMCKPLEEKGQRWRGHFSGVFNKQSTWTLNALDYVPKLPVAEGFDGPPDAREVSRAVAQLRNGKAAGASGILPEMLKASGEPLNIRLVSLFLDVWCTSSAPKEWVDATLVPVPKKGDLSKCDNWRGISLLDVVGKVLASVIQSRHQVIAAEFMPESQCGFRRGRSCTDMIFCVRQLWGKTIEHNTKGFFIFIDLRKT